MQNNTQSIVGQSEEKRGIVGNLEPKCGITSSGTVGGYGINLSLTLPPRLTS